MDLILNPEVWALCSNPPPKISLDVVYSTVLQQPWLSVNSELSFLGYHSLFSGVSQYGTNKSANFSMSPVLYTMKEFSKSYNGHMLLIASLHYMNGFCIGYKLH